MSLKKKAAQVRAAGHKNSRQDSMLAHITPREARFLKAGGGSGRKDPKTGLPHYEGFGDSDTGGFSDSGGYSSSDAGGYGGGWGSEGLSDLASMDVGSYGPVAGVMAGSPADNEGAFSDPFSNPYSELSWDSPLSDLTPTDVNSYGPVANVQAGSPAEGEADTFSEMAAKRARAMAMGQVASKLGIPGPVMSAVNIGMAKTPQDQARAFGNTVSSGILGAMGPLGMALGMTPAGKALGNALASFEGTRTDAQRAGASAATGAAGRAAGGAGGDFDIGGVLTGLAGLYQGNQAAGLAKGAQGLAQGQADTLANMYGPNSPYAAQLRQQLERKDAAGGRRSQYGPREVELQARLADVASRNAPNTLAAQQAAMGYGQQANRTRAQQFGTLAGLAKSSGLAGMAQRGLSGMFDGGGYGSTGTGGFSDAGVSYNNPSAYTAPDLGVPDTYDAYDFQGGGGSYWE